MTVNGVEYLVNDEVEIKRTVRTDTESLDIFFSTSKKELTKYPVPLTRFFSPLHFSFLSSLRPFILHGLLACCLLPV
jgi:hypothetical protein